MTRKRAKLSYRGGGWYRLSNGEKVRGAEKAMAAQQQRQQAQLTHPHDSSAGRQRFLRQATYQYGTARDVYKAAGYIAEGSETFDHYWSLYERDPVAGRIVDMPVKTTWRTPPEVFEGDKEKDNATEFETQWSTLVKRLRLWHQFERVDRLSRIGQYAVLLLGVREGEDMQLKNELPQLQGPDDLLYLSAFSQKYAEIKEWETDPSNERFGLPKMYDINLSSGVKSFTAKTVRVHHTRVLHVAEDTLVDDVYGRPALKRALNALMDLVKVSASTGEAYWQIATRILQGKIDPNMVIEEKAVTELGEKMEEIVHDLRRQFIGQGVELEWKTSEPPTPDKALALYQALLAVATGIPTRVFFGSEMGQLASAQDERAYFGTINERQEHHAEPNILRPFIDRLLGVGALKLTKLSEEYTVVWPALFELTDKEIAEANQARAETAKALTPMGGDPMELVEIDQERNVWLLPDAEVEGRGQQNED